MPCFLWVLESKLRSSGFGSKHSSPVSHLPSSVTFNKIKMFYGNQEIVNSFYQTRTAKIYQYFHFFSTMGVKSCAPCSLLKRNYLKLFRTEPVDRFSHLNFGFLRFFWCVSALGFRISVHTSEGVVYLQTDLLGF